MDKKPITESSTKNNLSNGGWKMFEVGGRYRNRVGWYEVLDIDEPNMRIRYEFDSSEHTFDIDMQRRIVSKIIREEESVTPFEELDDNKRYFKTLGYLAINGYIEAFIPQRNKSGFDRTYKDIKGRLPQNDQPGYCIHDSNINKWGTEMRLSFRIPERISLDELSFGPSANIVRSPNDNELRINNNGFCWGLLQLGFELKGAEHDIQKIESQIPERYIEAFHQGTSIV